jgi:subtilase family serine protease
MPNSWNEILTARQGSVVINDNKLFEANMYVITSVSDATIIDGLQQDGVDVLADYIAKPSVEVPRGSIITPRDINKPFTSIQLSAGAVCVTLGTAFQV